MKVSRSIANHKLNSNIYLQHLFTTSYHVMTCKNTLPWKSKPTKLYPLLKRESFHPCLAIRCFDWTSRATKKNTAFFSSPIWKVCWIKIGSCFFPNHSGGKFQNKRNFQKQTSRRCFQGGDTLSSHVDSRPSTNSTRLDPHLSGESLSSTPMEDFTPKGLS